MRSAWARNASITDASPCPIPTTSAPPAASRYRRPSTSHITAPRPRSTMGSSRSRTLPKTWDTALARVDALGVELLAHEPQLQLAGGLGLLEVSGEVEVPAGVGPNLLDRDSGVHARQAHPSIGAEAVHAHPGTHDRGSRAEPLLRAPPSEVAGARHEIDGLHEGPLRLGHDHERLACVDRDLASAARPRQPHLGLAVVADYRRVDVAVAVDLRCPQKGDVDQAALEVVGEYLEHARDREASGRERGVADRQRQSLRIGSEHAGLVDELELRRHRAPGEVAGDVGGTDADEADVLAGELPSRRHDHHL